MRLASRWPSIGRLAFGLVLRMTVHADAEEASERGPDTFDQGSGSDTIDESQFDEKAAELGLEPMKAYVRVARGKKEITDAAEAKRKYRARRRQRGSSNTLSRFLRRRRTPSTRWHRHSSPTRPTARRSALPSCRSLQARLCSSWSSSSSNRGWTPCQSSS